MKRYICLLILITVLISCKNRDKVLNTCSIRNKFLTIRNGASVLTMDKKLGFAIAFDNNRLTEIKSSVYLIDSAGNPAFFNCESALQKRIDDATGKGQMILVNAVSGDRSLRCDLSLISYDSIPDVYLVKSKFLNISAKPVHIKGLSLNDLSLRLPPDSSGWWSFQGAAYYWGKEFVFRLPQDFNRENYMGLNAPRYGGGIPLVDVWNKEYGLALAYIGDTPMDISLPVRADSDIIRLGINQKYRPGKLLPGDSIISVQTAIIIHRGDYFEPLRTYSHLMCHILPAFMEPDELTYEPEWCTWGYRQDFKKENITGRLERLKSLGIRSVIFDDGWSLSHGDWIPHPDKFPGGDKDFIETVDLIHKNGLKAWIWWVPGYIDSATIIASEHPEWLIKNPDGTIHSAYGLCPAFQPVQDHYIKLVKKFVTEYKLDGFKLDFGVINSAAPCYDPAHNHKDPYESFYCTPVLFKNILETARQYNPDILIEYCACSIPPTYFHFPYFNLAVTSDPNITQITERIKLYKALRSPDFPVLEEYCGVLAGPTYEYTIGTGGVPGTFSTILDDYHEKWLGIYHKYQLSKGEYVNLYDAGFDYPEGHAIIKDNKMYYAFYTHPWKQMNEIPRRWWRFGNEFDHQLQDLSETKFPAENFTGKIELRGLDKRRTYSILDYANDRTLGTIKGKDPYLSVSFDNYLLLELSPSR